MKTIRLVTMGMLTVALAGCLEVEQYPAWRNGEYDGKEDNLQQQTHFHSDRLAWNAAIANRNRRQNEFNRTNP